MSTTNEKAKNETSSAPKPKNEVLSKSKVNASLEALFPQASFAPNNLSSVTVKVDVEPSRLVEKLAVEIQKDVERITRMGGSDVEICASDRILGYLKTLTYLRVARVLGIESKATSSYKRIIANVAIPVLFYQALVCIGEAYDRDFSIRFIPSYDIDSSDLLSPEEVVEISEVLMRLETQGMKVVLGMPNTTDGTLDFMALCHVEGEVRGYRRSHPVYGFLSAFFAQKKFNEITGHMCRVLYGYESDYEMYVTRAYLSLTK